MGLKELIKDFYVGFWDYETPKIMVVKNQTLGIIYRIVQFLVITYFIWYVFISQKAYQESETRPESSIYTKMKGVALVGDTVQDVVEYVRPSEGGDVISSILRREITIEQRQGVCAEHYSVPGANCTTDSDCIEEDADMDGNGKRTGRCVPYYNHTFKTCEIKTWCPIEEFAAVREPPLEEAINFTVYIKNTIHFPKFRVLKGNVKPNQKRYLERCTYNEVKDIYCPIFRLGYIAEQARVKFSELLETGAVIGVFINWKCDLDLDPSECIPKYAFRRLDIRKDPLIRGYNYRFAKFYSRNGSEFRTLIKAYGIRLDVIVHGEAGKFSIIPTIINMVTALTSVGICSFLCDWILLTFIDKNEVYSEKKFDEVTNETSHNTVTEVTTMSQGSTHTDLSDSVAL
ncbi:P2X purinoceptor 2 [Lepisosteus oculatus]|uniref:P2X purinoceptor 2 n=1 Tax=Lepisosteus oculatus TaxID=7918 RepID=UPI0035F4FED6